jgi:hypothetical protein
MRNTDRTAFARWSPAACARFGDLISYQNDGKGRTVIAGKARERD